MTPLTFDDVLPLDEYAVRRPEFFASHRRYLDRYRRVRLGPDVSLLFENRQTIWFKLQEVLRVARLSASDRVQRELDWYNAALPGRGRLRASMVLGVPPGKIAQLQKTWSNFRGGDVCLLTNYDRIESTLITDRHDDLIAANGLMLEFNVHADFRASLIDGGTHIGCEIKHGGYEHRVVLPGPVRQSLAEDLTLSDRDAA